MIKQPKWDALSPKAKWDVIVTLRGPDCHKSDGIKWVTSSVIRHQLRGIMRVGGLINDTMTCVVLPLAESGGDVALIQNKDKPDAPTWDIQHFVQHVQEAAAWLEIPTVYVPLRIWLGFRGQSIGEINRILRGLKPEDYKSELNGSESLKTLAAHLGGDPIE